jgi:hypothetical protein
MTIPQPEPPPKPQLPDPESWQVSILGSRLGTSVAEKVFCMVCGSEGSLRYRGHDYEELPHPKMTEPDSQGRCALCGENHSALHDEHDAISGSVDPPVQ